MTTILILEVVIGLILLISAILLISKDPLKNKILTLTLFVFGIMLILSSIGTWFFSDVSSSIEDNTKLDHHRLAKVSEELEVEKDDIIITNYRGDRTLGSEQVLKLVHVNNKSYIFKFTGEELTTYTKINSIDVN